MGSGPGSPFGLEDKASWMFTFGGFTDSPHAHKVDVLTQYRLLLFFQESVEAKGHLYKKNPEISQACVTNHRDHLV